MCSANGRRRVRLIVWLFVAAAPAACVQKGGDGGRTKPLQPSAAFDNGMSAREPVPGTVARGQMRFDESYFTGKENNQYVTDMPARVAESQSLEDLLAR